MTSPLILYSETNVSNYINAKRFNAMTPPNYSYALNNVLFSRENIGDSLSKGTYYIGRVSKNDISNKFELANSYREIPKPEDAIEMFKYPTKRYVRSDGSTFIAQQMLRRPFKVNNVDVMRYDIFEIVKENGKNVIKRNTIFTERNFFNDKRQSMVDEYLSRESLDQTYKKNGGYIGYYDPNGTRIYNPDLVKHFEISKSINIETISKKINNINQIPSFSELKEFALKYEICYDFQNFINNKNSTITVKEIKTGKTQFEKSVVAKAIFANIWLSAAGIKYYENESRPGEFYAFNETTEALYNIICSELLNSCKNKGVIDTMDLFKNIESKCNYKYSKDIIVGLFRTRDATVLINQLFSEFLGIDYKLAMPEPLYSMSYAENAIYNNKK